MSATNTLHRPSPRAPQVEVFDRPAKPLREINPNALLGAIVTGATLVIGLWWINTESISGTADWLTNAGRITGLGAGYAVVVQLALMARAPIVERSVGADRLARWHSMGGRYTVSLIVAHALLIILGYSLTDNTDVVTTTGVLWTQFEGVLMATAATALFVGIGISSARAARKRLRYETWLFIHFYTYLAIALSFTHQFATGAEFVDNVPAQIFWGWMYAAVALFVIWFRFVTPVRQSLKHNLRVAKVVRESEDATTIYVTGHHLEQLQAIPGQFFRWRFMTPEMWWSANPYSLSDHPEKGYLRITVQDVGDHSHKVRQLRPGTRVFAEGPYGALTPARSDHRSVLLIAGGAGITPMRTLFEEFSHERGRAVMLIYRASNTKEVLFRKELDRIRHHYGSRVVYAVGRRGSRSDILQPKLLKKLSRGLVDCDVYMCGPKGMTEAAHASLQTCGVNKHDIHIEDFSF